jgi:hypothetical protein
MVDEQPEGADGGRGGRAEPAGGGGPAADQGPGPRALPDAAFAALLDRLLSIPWPVPKERMRPLAEAWGWPATTDSDEDGGFEADPGFRLGPECLADFDAFEGELVSVAVGTSAYVTAPTQASNRALDEAFSRQVAIGRARLGPPERRLHGTVASATWNLPDGPSIEVARSEHSCWVEIVSAEEAQCEDEPAD